MKPREALGRLIQGNRRFASGQQAPVDIVERRKVTAAGQTPLAAVVACADSRVAPEIIFDTTLGELYVVRTAGNVVDELVLGSLRFAVEVLGAPLVVVLGHYGCGAVKATCAGGTPSHLECISDEIRPSLLVTYARGLGAPDVVTDEVVRVHAATMGKRVASDIHLDGSAPVVWGVYDSSNGEVIFDVGTLGSC
ncbi:MAG: carbonic anhydrase [Coriobacteriia bacterium]|jgi:carbonic anhydrase|nr:carbonic anhydrase [Coriobacteriia bacterium]